MTTAPFRAGRDNAGFLVELEMSVVPDADASLREEVQRWLRDEWAPSNQLWRRVCRDASGEYVRNLLYSDEFSAPPCVLADGSLLRLVVEGRSCARYWREWLVARLIPDVRARFPQVGAVRLIRNFEQI
jgi:hypothetical protein